MKCSKIGLSIGSSCLSNLIGLILLCHLTSDLGYKCFGSMSVLGCWFMTEFAFPPLIEVVKLCWSTDGNYGGVSLSNCVRLGQW